MSYFMRVNASPLIMSDLKLKNSHEVDQFVREQIDKYDV